MQIHVFQARSNRQFSKPGRIDMILGADVFEEIFLEKKITLTKRLTLPETVFGWVVIGQTDVVTDVPPQTFHCLDVSLQQFWEIEEVPRISKFNGEELLCQDHYTRTTKRDETGRFVVQPFFKNNALPLADSLSIAKKRFLSLEKRLSKLPEVKNQYIDFINEFSSLGHMEVIPPNEIDIKPAVSFYLPHHFVIESDSTTTKLRVVFDASAKTTSNTSLNSNLMVGPKNQSDLFDILLRLRFHKNVLSADFAKIYREVALDRPDQDFHRVLWRETENEPLQHLRMTRVCYGITSAGYDSVRSVVELAETAPKRVRKVLENDMYVDDLLTGCSNISEARTLQDTQIAVSQQGGFPLRKWTSNESELIKRLPVDLQETKDELTLGAMSTKSKLLVWYGDLCPTL